jgi:DNA-binding transcriptional LysR family regulator
MGLAIGNKSASNRKDCFYYWCIAVAASLDLFAVFAKVGESGSFTRAARELGLSKATVSKQVSQLERDLGVALIARTTRRAGLTEAGERVLRRALRMLEERDAAHDEAGEARSAPRGRLKVSAPLSFGVTYLSPAIGDFLAAYPDIQLELALEDRTVDLIGEGYDAALRIGTLEDSSLIARQIAPVGIDVLASPGYLSVRGTPRRPEDLALHAGLHYTNQAAGNLWRFEGPNGERAQVRVNGPFCANNGDLLVAAAVAGQGVIIVPRFLSCRAIAEGRLVPILADWKVADLSLHLLSPPGRSPPRKLRVFSDFVAERFAGGRAPWR